MYAEVFSLYINSGPRYNMKQAWVDGLKAWPGSVPLLCCSAGGKPRSPGPTVYKYLTSRTNIYRNEPKV